MSYVSYSKLAVTVTVANLLYEYYIIIIIIISYTKYT